MSTLTLIQRRRLEMRLEGKNIRQIAQAEKADYKSVKETFLQIQKKFKLFFKIPPQISP
jgi:DNA-binding CsgD family transcriptional regulator